MSSDPHTFTDPVAPDPIRYMVRRWPPATLLDNDPDKVRMTSLLAAQALSMDELADLSGQTLARCAEFLQALHEHDVLEVHVPPIPVAEVPTQPSPLDERTARDALAFNLAAGADQQTRHPH